MAQRAVKPVPAPAAAAIATPAKPAVVEVPLVTPEPVVAQPVENLPMLEEQDIVVNPNAVPNIALLLPLEDANFSEAALAVRDGFMAAAGLNPSGLAVRVYGDFDENRSVVASYRKAIANGAQAVVGPLTRKGVSSLAAERNIPVPTLVLNTVDAHPADRLFFFGLPADDEARTVADLAARNKKYHNAVVISSGSPLAQRLQFAFEESWSKAGLSIAREIDFKGDPSVLSGLFTIPNPAAKLAKNADDPTIPETLVIPDTMVFLATDMENARQIRPYLPGKLPTYATSQIFSGNDSTLTNYDLNGIRFVDMPWLLQPDHPAVIAYPHYNEQRTAVQERLYALGIDAYRLVQLMLAHTLDANLPLDGVIGRIELNGHTFQRTAVAGVFNQGRAVSTEAVTAPPIQMFPDQFKTKP